MNGTTNYILTQMTGATPHSYEVALRAAQQLGFAEADPTADVEGHDVRAKIAILAKLAFGVSIPLEMIPTVGIAQLSIDDLQPLLESRFTIKLLGIASLEKNGGISVYVIPAVVPFANLFATVSGCGNMVRIIIKSLFCPP
jgi:homoserine dehydrogenase